MFDKKVMVGGEEFHLDPERLEFNEANLSKHMQEEAAWFNHVGQKLADAEKELQLSELTYEIKYHDKFRSFKELGGSDKLAESNAKSDVEVEVVKTTVIEIKHAVKSLQAYMKSMDKCHVNAHNFGHMLRKEMDKLMTDIRRTSDEDLEKKVDDIVGK